MEKGWTAIERHSEIHVVPVVPVPHFPTWDEAQAFAIKLEAEGNPAVTIPDDEDLNRLYTYFGHELSPKCNCHPELVPDQRADARPTFRHNHSA